MAAQQAISSRSLNSRPMLAMRSWAVAVVRILVALGLLWAGDIVHRAQPWADRLADLAGPHAASRDWGLSYGYTLLVGFAIAALSTLRWATGHYNEPRQPTVLRPLVLSLYPPRPWLQAFLGSLIAWRFISPVPQWAPTDLVVLGLVMFLGVVGCLGLTLALRPAVAIPQRCGSAELSSAPHSIDEAASRWDEIIEWASHDGPITGPAEDWFDRSHDANLLYRRLTSELSYRAGTPSIALLGPAGSGKTSLRHMLAAHFADDVHRPVIHFAEVSAWHYADRVALYRAVLRAIIDTIDRHVSTVSAKGLPGAYAQVAAKTDTLIGAIASLGDCEAEPKQLVQRLSDLASAADISVVVWLDDTERVSMFKDDDAAAMGSLLRLLRDAPSLAFVLAKSPTIQDHPIIDAAKLVDYTEYLRVDPERIAVLLGALRRRCLDYLEERGLVDPAQRDRHRLLEAFESSAARILMTDTESVVGALISLVDTPRRIKVLIRRVWGAWTEGQLAGEIDIDSLILYHALREADAGDLKFHMNNRDFSFNISDLLRDPRIGRISADGHDRSDRDRASLDKYAMIGQALASQRRSPHPSTVVLHTLFCGLGPHHPQSFRGESSSEYIQRASTERRDLARLDQPFLQFLASIRDPDGEPTPEGLRCLARRIVDPSADQLRGGLERFGLLSTRAWNGLVRPIARELIRHEAARQESFVDDHEALVLMARARKRMNDLEPLEKWARRYAVLAVRLRGALQLAHEFVYWWGPEEGRYSEESALWFRDTTSALASSFCEWAEGATASEVAKTFSEGKAWTLDWLAMQHWIQSEDLRSPPQVWRPAIQYLLKGSEADPQPVGRALAVVAVQVQHRYRMAPDDLSDSDSGSTYVAVPRVEDLEALCPPELLPEVWRLLSKLDPDQIDADGQLRVICIAARNLARQKLGLNVESPPHQP